MCAEESDSRVVLILGGVRSGKSRWAQQLAAQGERVAFIATAEARDEEMARRIARHREDRPAHWSTVEAPIDIPQALRDCAAGHDTLVVDCLTLWSSNLMEHESENRERIRLHVDRLVQALREIPAKVILVSNEVGSGIVPDSEMARTYRDVLGEINQRVAESADEVVLMVAGYPLTLKQPAESVPA